MTKPTQDQLREWIEKQGMTHEQVGKICGVAHQTVSKWCRKFGVKTQRTGPRSGPLHPDWKGGRTIDKNGYVLLYMPSHPNALRPSRRYVLEHRAVMEKHLKRYLTRSEVVHHKNGVKSDNRIENLELFDCNANHLRYELTGRIPHWTEDGKRRIAEGIRRRDANRAASKASAQQNSQTTPRSTE